MILAAGLGLTACWNPDFPGKPSREAYEGFEWEVVSGAGLKFWAQRNSHVRIVTDDALQAARIEYTGGDNDHSRIVIRIFPLKNGRVEDVIPLIRQHGIDGYTPWRDEDKCAFMTIGSVREGVERYILTPTGKAGREMAELGRKEPIPCTCGGWGVGNSGMRYFETHSSHPGKAVFVEIGQEMPLFDEMSITLTGK